MQMIMDSKRGLEVLIELNWDRLLYIGMIALCLALSAYVASATLANPFIL